MSLSSTRIFSCVASFLPRLFVSYIVLALLLALCLAQPALAELSGELWCAQKGVAIAQFDVALRYYEGDGVPQNYKKAIYWYRKAAKQGLSAAQNNLGVMYELGQGIPKDYTKAHMWFNLAAAQGNKKARKNRDELAVKMTAKQIAEAQRLASEWKPTKQP